MKTAKKLTILLAAGALWFFLPVIRRQWMDYWGEVASHVETQRFRQGHM